jgi:fructose transport system permease protein
MERRANTAFLSIFVFTPHIANKRHMSGIETPNTGEHTGRETAATAVASFAEPAATPLKRIQHALHANPTAIPTLVLVASLIFFSAFVGSRFLHPFNFSLILQQVTVIGIVAIAQTLIILTAGIDLSVGAILVLTSVVMGRFAIDLGWPVPLAIAAGLGVGALCGGVNGVLVTRFKLPPFIVTLGTWNIFFALNLWYSASETIRAQDLEAKAPLLLVFGTGIDFLGARLTLGSILMIVMVVATLYVLNWTRFGRHLYAAGDDIESAKLAGVRTDRTLMWVYVVAGIICGIAGWVLIGRIGSVSPQAGQTANLDSITAVVIGGTSLFGGRGSIVGTLMGALIVGVFRNGMALSGVNVLWQEFAVGLLIIIAVAVDQWLRRTSA